MFSYWNLFQKSGTIEAYMAYKEEKIQADERTRNKYQKIKGEEER